MEPTFYIDRQFGCAIFIKVENGIVQKVWNGDSQRYDDKMNELYIGKSISFLTEDFEKRMHGASFHCVHSFELAEAQQILRGCESAELDFERFLRRKYDTAIPNDKFSTEDCRKLKEVQENRYQAKTKIEITKGIVKGIHGFDVDVINQNRAKLREKKYRTT